MTEFGNILRAAREAKGLTPSQLAEQTHLTVARIEQLEKDDFSHIPAAIYGRGFVRLYCEAVGLDAKTYTDEFTEIYNGNRDTEIRERPAAPATAEPPPERPTASTSPTLTEAPPVIADVLHSAQTARPIAESLFPSEPEPTNEPEPSCSPTPEPTPTPEATPVYSRYAAPLRDERVGFSVSPAIWRFAVLGIGSLLLLIALGYGVRALYRATSNTPAEQQDEATLSAEIPATVPTVPKSTGPRTPQKIPPLYID